MGKTTLNFSQEMEAFWGRDAKTLTRNAVSENT